MISDEEEFRLEAENLDLRRLLEFDRVQRIAPRAALPPTKSTPFARLSAFAAPIELSIGQAQRSWQTTIAVAAPTPTPVWLADLRCR
jgi:hypothetical protein